MQLFLDCDGVLANFDEHFEEIAGEPASGFEDKHGAKAFWKVVMSDPDFFFNLKPMPGAMTLVKHVKKYNPIILTGCPQGNWSQPQKQRWRHKYFPDLPMVTCESKNKYHYMIPGVNNVLIDDWAKYQEIWEQNNGIFILHTSAKESIQQFESVISNIFGI